MLIENQKKIYAKIINRLLNGDKISTLSNEQIEWLEKNPKIKNYACKIEKRIKIMKNFENQKDTIEEILFVLGLSTKYSANYQKK